MHSWKVQLEAVVIGVGCGAHSKLFLLSTQTLPLSAVCTSVVSDPDTDKPHAEGGMSTNLKASKMWTTNQP